MAKIKANEKDTAKAVMEALAKANDGNTKKAKKPAKKAGKK